DDLGLDDINNMLTIDSNKTEAERIYHANAYVERVIDGDTVILTDIEPQSDLNDNHDNQSLPIFISDLQSEERARLILINSPEICHGSSDSTCEPESYGEEAKQFTKDLIGDKNVYLRFLSGT